MNTYVIWETWLTREGTEEGLVITKKIWTDMPHFDGYLGHMLLRGDDDDAGHLTVVSLWKTRQAADDIKEIYADNPNVAALQPLLRRERGRTVYTLDEANGVIIP